MKWDAEWGQYLLGRILKRAVSAWLCCWNTHWPRAGKTVGGDHKSHWWQLIYTPAWVTVSVEVGGGEKGVRGSGSISCCPVWLILMLTPNLLSTLPFMRTNWVWRKPALVYSTWSSRVINYQSRCRLWCKHSPVWYWPTTSDLQGKWEVTQWYQRIKHLQLQLDKNDRWHIWRSSHIVRLQYQWNWI